CADVADEHDHALRGKGDNDVIKTAHTGAAGGCGGDGQVVEDDGYAAGEDVDGTCVVFGQKRRGAPCLPGDRVQGGHRISRGKHDRTIGNGEQGARAQREILGILRQGEQRRTGSRLRPAGPVDVPDRFGALVFGKWHQRGDRQILPAEDVVGTG